VRERVSGTVFSVRLQPSLHQKVQRAAEHHHIGPSALIRMWIAEKVEREPSAQGDDLLEIAEVLAHDVGQLRRLAGAA
jgi:predicted transcriptional regulator